jgi:asparagine synthase (glutamine-hydrolysing)
VPGTGAVLTYRLVVCGICGVALFDASDEQIREVLWRMMAAIAHRGPDDRGWYLDPGAGSAMACQRLALVGLVDGHQPIASEDGSVVVVMNGEIYNHRTLRRGLEQRGHRFSGHSDAEVVVHLYEECSERCLPQLDGMFALAILDRPRARVVLARDGPGMKPLWYARTPQGLAFASEAKALFDAGLVEPQPRWEAIDTFLTVGFVPAPRTCFAGVEKLPAGHFLTVERERLQLGRHWRFGFRAPSRDDRPYSDELDGLLRNAVHSHVDAEVPVGLLLSGGWDSSLLAVFASASLGHPPPTFSVTLPDHPSLDEGPYARLMARHLGSQHHEVEFRASNVPELLREALWHREEPSPGPVLLEYVLARLAAVHVKAVLSGQGSDELLGGYPWYQSQRSWGSPTAEDQGAAAPDPRHDDAEWLRILRPEEKERLGFPSGPDVDPYLLDDDVYDTCTNRLQARMALDFTRRLGDGLLMTADRTSMAHGLEVRLPFLDRSVVAFAEALPPERLVAGGQEKAVLAPLAHRYLPPAIANRRKLGLQYPLGDWLRRPLLPFVQEVLLESTGPDFIDRRALETMLRQWLETPSPNTRAPWALLVFQVWWQVWFSGRPAPPAVR